VLSAFPDLAPYVHPDRVLFMPGSPGKREVLLTLGDRIAQHPAITNRAAYLKALFDREDVTSTGVGGGVAVPHAQLASITGFVIAIGICPGGVDFAAKDGNPVRIVVMIAAPTTDRPAYLKILASVAARLSRPEITTRMLAAGDAEAVIDAFIAGSRRA
jgi:mannitol/fructose-specific phosphotransferase system IIA component (Ntr-type)